MLDTLKRISTALGLLAAIAAVTPAQAKPPIPSLNQAKANAVANALRSSPNLVPYRIEIEVAGNVVTLTGQLATPAQKSEALALATSVPGVTAVSDHLAVATDNPIRTVQYQVPAGMNRVASGHASGDIIYDGGAPAGPGSGYGYGGAPAGPGYGYGAPSGPGMGPMDGPAPEGPSGVPGATSAAMPRNPNYAWPSYAPYPNFSAVGYPTVYPWQAWPNIAPPYPYPEVPLDWRAVTLRWDDGLWWLDFKKNYTRPFFTPYPFGIFAY
jgi:hypothetical protein